MSSGAEAEQRSGSGWVSLMSLPESPDQAFIREFMEKWDDYQESQFFHPWPIEQLSVGYWDLNDDGVEEMFVSFDGATSYFCGTGGCTGLLFGKRGSQWQFLHFLSGFGIWVGEDREDLSVMESIDSFDILEVRKGYRFFWSRNLCEPVEPELRNKIPESFITNLSC